MTDKLLPEILAAMAEHTRAIVAALDRLAFATAAPRRYEREILDTNEGRAAIARVAPPAVGEVVGGRYRDGGQEPQPEPEPQPEQPDLPTRPYGMLPEDADEAAIV